jgi:hypothetical protein
MEHDGFQYILGTAFPVLLCFLSRYPTAPFHSVGSDQFHHKLIPYFGGIFSVTLVSREAPFETEAWTATDVRYGG